MNRVVTPKIEARIRDLKTQGLSLRKISAALALDGIEISYETVSQVLKHPENPAAKRARTLQAAVEEPAGTDAPEDAPEAIKRLFERLETVKGLGAQAAADGDLSGFRDMTKLELELVAKITALLPPKPPDPEDDPANVSARDTTRARILDMIEDSEHRAGRMCTKCMRAPRIEARR